MVAAVGGLLVGAVLALLLSGSVLDATTTRAPSTIDAAAPIIVGAGSTRAAQPMAGPQAWFVAHVVTGPDACPPGWVCLFENMEFNEHTPGWMVLAQNEDKVYNLVGQYDHAVSSWINNAPVDAGWHEEPNAQGGWHGIKSMTSQAELGAEAATMSSLHLFTDTHAFTAGTKP